jgi:hypothetical protein
MNNLPSEHCPTNVVMILSSIYSHKRDRSELIKLELELAILNTIYGVYILLRKLLKYK